MNRFTDQAAYDVLPDYPLRAFVSLTRSFARLLFALWLTLWLLPSPLVWAQTGTGAAAATQSEAEARIGPEGEQLREVDSPNGAQGPEPVLWIAEVSGVYQLEVRSLEKTAKAGRYEATLNEVRPATASDRTEVEKALALAEAVKLNNESVRLGNAGQNANAMPLAERVLSIREKALGAEHPNTTASLYTLASLYDAKGDYAKAEPLYQRALTISEKALGRAS